MAGILGTLVEAGLPLAMEECGSGEDGVRPSGGAEAGRSRATAYLEGFRSELVSLLMSLLSDDSETVAAEARRLLGEVGEVR